MSTIWIVVAFLLGLATVVGLSLLCIEIEFRIKFLNRLYREDKAKWGSKEIWVYSYLDRDDQGNWKTRDDHLGRYVSYGHAPKTYINSHLYDELDNDTVELVDRLSETLLVIRKRFRRDYDYPNKMRPI